MNFFSGHKASMVFTMPEVSGMNTIPVCPQPEVCTDMQTADDKGIRAAVEACVSCDSEVASD